MTQAPSPSTADKRSRAPSDLIEDVAHSEIGQKSGRGALVSLTARVSNLFLTLLAQAILGRLLNPSEYGIYAMGMTALSFLLIFREFGLQAAGVQKEKLSYAEASFLFWANLGLIVVLGLAGVIAAPFVAHFYGSPEVTVVLTTMSVAAILGGASAQHTMILRRQLRFTAVAMIDMAALACGVIAGLIVGWLRHDVWALLAMYLVQQGMTSVLSFAVSRWVPGRPNFARATHMPMLQFGAGVTAANILYYITNNISAILIGKELGSALLGHFNRAQQLNSIPSTVLFSSVYIVVFASLSRLTPDPEQYRQFYKATLRRVGMFYMFLSGTLIFCGMDLVLVLIGPGWEIAGHVLQIFAIALVGSGMAQMSGMLYQSQGRIRDFQVWGVIDSIIRVGCILISSRWGLYGLAFGFALSTTFITAPASLWYVGRKGPVSLSDQVSALRPALLMFLFAFAGAGAIQWLLRDMAPGIVPLFAKSLGAVLFCVGLGLLVPMTRSAFLEILRGLYGLADTRTSRFLPFYSRLANASPS